MPPRTIIYRPRNNNISTQDHLQIFLYIFSVSLRLPVSVDYCISGKKLLEGVSCRQEIEQLAHINEPKGNEVSFQDIDNFRF